MRLDRLYSLAVINKRIPFSQKTPFNPISASIRLRKSNPWRDTLRKKLGTTVLLITLSCGIASADYLAPQRTCKINNLGPKDRQRIQNVPSLVINGGMIMLSNSQVILELPEEKDIETVEEMSMPSNPGLIRKTIRYRNGVTAVLFQDFQESVFSIQLKSDDPFWISQNRVLKVS